MSGNKMIWLFAYGSLIWRPGFEFSQRQLAVLDGYERRFCQASHDHRGSLDQPGRVVTLLPMQKGQCSGIAFGLDKKYARSVLPVLDEREQDGYIRAHVDVVLENGSLTRALTWIAQADNPSWRGGEAVDVAAAVIAASTGQSGSNKDYLYQLDAALLKLNIEDKHVRTLTDVVRSIETGPEYLDKTV